MMNNNTGKGIAYGSSSLGGKAIIAFNQQTGDFAIGGITNDGNFGFFKGNYFSFYNGAGSDLVIYNPYGHLVPIPPMVNNPDGMSMIPVIPGPAIGNLNLPPAVIPPTLFLPPPQPSLPVPKPELPSNDPIGLPKEANNPNYPNLMPDDIPGFPKTVRPYLVDGKYKNSINGYTLKGRYIICYKARWHIVNRARYWPY